MSNRWPILVAILVLLMVLLLLSGSDEGGGPPEPEAAPPDGAQDPTPPGVPPPAPTDAGELVDAPESESKSPSGGLSIAGRVLSSDGVQPAKACLCAVPVIEPGDSIVKDAAVVEETETDKNSRFRIDGLRPGRYRLLVDPIGDANGPPEEAPVVDAGDEDVVVTLEPRAILTVKIVTDPGGPERTRNTLTFYDLFDEQGVKLGSCRLHGLDEAGLKHAAAPGRNYRVVAGRDGYRQVGSGEFFVPPGTREMVLTVRLEPQPERDQAKVTFRIRDERGDPVRRIFIQGQVDPSVFMGDLYELEAGEIELSLAAGRWKFVFERHHRAGRLEEPYLRTGIEVELHPGERTTRDVTLRCGGWIRFYLPEGCAERTIVCGIGGKGLREIETRPAPDGKGLLPDVKGPFLPGEYIAYLRFSDRKPVRTEFTVRPFDETEVRLHPPEPR